MKQFGIPTLTLMFIFLLLLSGVLWWTDFTREAHMAAGRPASAFSFGLPFGGPISDVDLTTCCGAAIITVDNYNPTWEGDQELLYYYGSPLFENYNLFTTNNNVVGDAIPIGICLEISSYPPCTDISTYDGIITIVGTE